MNDASHAVDVADTLRPPPPPSPRNRRSERKLSAAKPVKRLAVVAYCPNEKQQTMLLEWLAEQGFDVEATSL